MVEPAGAAVIGGTDEERAVALLLLLFEPLAYGAERCIGRVQCPQVTAIVTVMSVLVRVTKADKKELRLMNLKIGKGQGGSGLIRAVVLGAGPRREIPATVIL